MNTTITPELRAELMTMLRQELEQQELEKKVNRNTYRRVCSELESSFERYDYVEVFDSTDCYGRPFHRETQRLNGWKVREAIGTLLRIMYKVSATAKLPADKENDIRKFVIDVLSLMEERKQ